MESKDLRVVECYDLPENPDLNTVYKMLPKNPDEAFYKERTDRNIGWITPEEQQIVKNSVVGVAACGGIGGSLNERLLRLGIGEIRIADGESFDISNINRQFAATRSTVGKNKALETARFLRRITDDSTIVVFPQGIAADTVKDFVSGCDIICDEIEFFEINAAIMLHKEARVARIPILGCNTVGFGAHLFLFTSSSMTIEEVLGLKPEEAEEIDRARRSGTISEEKLEEIVERLILCVAPEAQEYCIDGRNANLKVCRRRLLKEGKAPIITTNPAFATGFIADWTLLYLLRNSGLKRDIVEIPEMPGYLYLDAAKMQAKVVTKKR
jgi:molybdopterin/thiamine biosynthesis adenylyltransferase